MVPRRRWQFGLPALFTVVTAICIGLWTAPNITPSLKELSPRVLLALIFASLVFVAGLTAYLIARGIHTEKRP